MYNTFNAVTLLPQLPPLPAELAKFPDSEDLILANGTTIHQVGTYYQMNMLKDSKLVKCCKPASVKLSESCVAWITENIVSSFINARLNYYIPQEDTCDSIGIHTDMRGDYALLYNLDTGGPNAKLTIWQEPDYPLIREKALVREDPALLDRIAEFIGPNNCWYLINLRALHSVENIIRPRINIQIKLENQHVQLIKI